MINIDDILYNLVTDKIEEIKADPNILDTIFYGKSADDINNIKQFISTQKIRIVKHHPRDASDFPCYSIVLESSAESEQIIGSSGAGDDIEISKMSDGWIGSDSDIFIGNIAHDYSVPQTVRQTYNTLETKDGFASCHLIGKQYESEDKGVWIDFENSVLEGGYISLVDITNIHFWVKSNRIGSWLQFGFGEDAHEEHVFTAAITTRNVWERVRVDLSGIDLDEIARIRYMSFKIIDDSQPTDIFIGSLKGEKDLGSVYEETFLDNRYRIEIWTNNADLTLNLYTLLLWLMLRYRNYLEESWGLIESRIEGGDVIPQPEWIPEIIYIRSLTISCKTIESVPRETDLTALTVTLGKTDFSG